MAAPYASLACNLDANILRASLPLFSAEQVDALEWAFDTLYAQPHLPDWFEELLLTFGEAGRLVGHGVFFSLFSGRWNSGQQAWLNHLRAASSRYRFDHVTEHFGFMTGADFHTGAPLSVPLTPNTLALGQDRLRRIQDAAQCPVGLENLAFAYSADEVRQQGDFLHRLLEPINGFLILDLHNLYCQSQNFGLNLSELLTLYPLNRVRELHLSGGSWEESAVEPGRQIRRDTHDEAVPPELFNWLAETLSHCPNLKFVVLEQLGTGLQTEAAQHQFQADFGKMRAVLEAHKTTTSTDELASFLPVQPVAPDTIPADDPVLFAQQRQLATILETASNYEHARQLLQTSELAYSAWGIEHWQPAMLETAMAIAQKWKRGFEG